jgi:multiple sugar transport system permease protein
MLTDDPRFLKELQKTTIYVFVPVPLQLAFALLLAPVLDRGVRGLAVYRSVCCLPSLLGSSPEGGEQHARLSPAPLTPGVPCPA